MFFTYNNTNTKIPVIHENKLRFVPASIRWKTKSEYIGQNPLIRNP